MEVETNRPVKVLQMISITVAAADLDPIIANRLDNEVRELENVLGSCERILRTPMYTSYTRHTSRFLFTWLAMLPLVLWPLCGVYCTPATVLIAYSLLAIEDIGVMIEEPFDILPLWRAVEMVDDSAEIAVAHLCEEREYERMKRAEAQRKGVSMLPPQQTREEQAAAQAEASRKMIFK
mmetsp:Transcript_8196/g.16121  ORF Transcript_8196/g.16121 Transcript_8196/m.16121 type:complete len:179 (-) Transcript_8196:557-1093(-)